MVDFAALSASISIAVAAFLSIAIPLFLILSLYVGIPCLIIYVMYKLAEKILDKIDQLPK